jgi:phosphatidylglycerol:prolipoprotein diacylglycerol transferase
MFDGITIDPIAFTIPIGDGFAIHWYGIIVTLGIAIGVVWAASEIRKRHGDVDEFYNGLIVVILSGFVFARLWYVLQEIIAGRGDQYNSLGRLVDIRAGGLNILGGFIGAAVIGYLFIRWRGLDFWLYADVAGPALLIAQSIGRWGNFINQELYGPPTSLPWGIQIDARHRIGEYTDLTTYPLDTHFHPTFLYESLWLLIGFGLLVFLNSRYRRTWKRGVLFGGFMIWWGVGRAWIEFFRPDQPKFGNSPISYSMVLAFLLAVAGGLLILARYNKLPIGNRAQRRRKRIYKPKPKRDTPADE